ncbi:MAG TPA: hypothetical protein VMI31_00640 [Fimbriimonadaceae bacterium]|nr:hypothetical protein [Fimbriimonadaceae bacterium]
MTAERIVAWRQISHEGKARTLAADFGEGRTIEMEIVSEYASMQEGANVLALILGAPQTTTPVDKVWRVTCGGLVIAANRVRPGQIEFYSSGEPVSMIFEKSPHKGRFVFGGETAFGFEPDAVAGHWLCKPEGTRLIRQVPPWRDSDIEAGVKLLSHISDDRFPWPRTGIALALLSVIDTVAAATLRVGAWTIQPRLDPQTG